MTISYAITAKDEISELDKLLSVLQPHLKEGDEILVQLDIPHPKEIEDVLIKYNQKWIELALNNDFASFKNNLKNITKCDYIFFIDADEYPNEHMMKYLRVILEMNPEVELYEVPRWNVVEEITDNDIRRWRWFKDEFGRINYPDFQTRIIKNVPHISWKGKVHEKLMGAKCGSKLPINSGYDLHHIKTIDKQRKQNEFYSTI